MRLENIIQPTGVITEGMTIRDGFIECVKNNVPGIPCVDAGGKVTACFSIRKTIMSACIPAVLVKYADLLGDIPDCTSIPEEHARQVLSLPADTFINHDVIAISSASTIAKSVALMEKHKVSYLFVIDDDKYHGVVTIENIARRMLEF